MPSNNMQAYRTLVYYNHALIDEAPNDQSQHNQGKPLLADNNQGSYSQVNNN